MGPPTTMMTVRILVETNFRLPTINRFVFELLLDALQNETGSRLSLELIFAKQNARAVFDSILFLQLDKVENALSQSGIESISHQTSWKVLDLLASIYWAETIGQSTTNSEQTANGQLIDIMKGLWNAKILLTK